MARRLFAFLAAVMLLLGAAVAGGGVAAASPESFAYFAGSGPVCGLAPDACPDVAGAPNGDRIELTGAGLFAVQPKSASGGGTFVHRDANGTVLASGTWTATELLSYHSYGCGVVMGTPLPDNLCGGAVKFRVTLATPLGQLPGIMTIFCIVGPKAPSSHDSETGEGVTVVVPGIINFNHTDGGENIYVKVS